MSEVLVRQAMQSDVPSMRRLQVEWEQEGITYGFVAAGEDELEAMLDSYTLVAEVDGCVVGFATASVRISDGLAVVARGEMYLEIDDVYVARVHRRRGIGSMLVTRLLDMAREKGIGSAIVYSAAKEIYGVLSFYQKHGFESWFVQMFKEL